MSKDNKENVDPKKDVEVLAKVCVPWAFVALKPLASTRYAMTEIDILASLQWWKLFYMQAPPMETSQTPNVAHASGPVFKVHTSEPLVLHDLFQSRSLLLQYCSGMMDADGSIGVNRKDAERFQGMVRFNQSNLAFLTAINAEFGYTGSISTHYAAGTRANVNEGRYSNGEMRQTLTFLSKAAVEVSWSSKGVGTIHCHKDTTCESVVGDDEVVRWCIDKGTVLGTHESSQSPTRRQHNRSQKH